MPIKRAPIIIKTTPLAVNEKCESKKRVKVNSTIRRRPPFDIFSDYRAEYEVSRRGGKIRFTWLEDELDKAMNTVRRMLPSLDAVPKWEDR